MRDWYVRSSAQLAIFSSLGFDDIRHRRRLQNLCLALLDDSHAGVRGNAATDLARLRARDTIPQILAHIVAAPPRGVDLGRYVRALEILCEGEVEPALAGIPGISKVVPVLIAMVTDENETEDEPETPAYVLGQIGPRAKEAVPVLRRALAASEEAAKQRKRDEGFDFQENYERPTFRRVLKHSLELIEHGRPQ